ncbi:hypothetical protein VZH09_03735 [Synechococcus elongatus IITB7]|uniref:hypothetical protein n=1 Tax=Synechococcus elongatus TaxID=32046 RepID=UPI0030CDB3C2
MTITLNVYGLTQQRSLTAINAFVEEHCDRAVIEDLEDSALMILRPDATDPDREESYDFLPVDSLSQAIAVGLEQPSWAFSLYLPAKDPTIDQVTVSFCRDRQLVLGLALPDTDTAPQQAQAFLREWADCYDCRLGLIAVEALPPLDTQDLARVAQRSLLTLFVGPCRSHDPVNAEWPSVVP